MTDKRGVDLEAGPMWSREWTAEEWVREVASCGSIMPVHLRSDCPHKTPDDGDTGDLDPADLRTVLDELAQLRNAAPRLIAIAEAAREYLLHDGSGIGLDPENPWRGDYDARAMIDARTALRALLDGESDAD